MKYVLVSLVGDEATQHNDEFARWFAGEHVPVRAFHEERPDHSCIKAAVQDTRTAIVMGHDGGGSLRARAAGPPWATADEFADMFYGARVWAFACSTRSSQLEEDLASFGRQARAGGVAVFAGHASAITATPPLAAFPGLKRRTYEALARGFRMFLQGSNSANDIRNHALRDRGRPTALVALSIEEAFQTLRVLA